MPYIPLTVMALAVAGEVGGVIPRGYANIIFWTAVLVAIIEWDR